MKLPAYALPVLLALALGCASTSTHGVPNLVQVSPQVWRGGQPTTSEGWNYLRGLGVRHVLKLNFPPEGADDLARVVGLDVVELAIEPRTNPPGVVDAVEDVFAMPDKAQLAAIVEQLRGIVADGGSTGGWYIHCKNGHDRTGLAVGMLRVLSGWAHEAAWREMLDRGFHPELIGLLRAWRNFTPANGGAP